MDGGTLRHRKALEALRHRFGERIQTGAAVCANHTHTTSWIAPEPPDAVFQPASTEEVSEAVRLCAAHRCPVIPFGAGTSLEGQLNAPVGGLSMDMGAMNRILSVCADDLDCTVQPGVTRNQLSDWVRSEGLFFPIDPGADASLGGMASTRASGTTAVRYGTMRQNVLALEVVLANGDVVRTGTRARKSAAGYDLTGLFVGSEGTLGVITELTLRLYGLPEKIVSGTCAFPSVAAAVNAVIELIQMGLAVARVELMDTLAIRAVNGHSKLELPERPTLFFEFHGKPQAVDEQVESFREICDGHEGDRFAAADRPEDRSRLWKARHDLYFAFPVLRTGARGVPTDACVPISRLAQCIDETRRDMEGLRLLAPCVGHVGDGNFHLMILIDPDNSDEVARAREGVRRLTERALSMGGTCTGEHGIGQGKIEALRAEAASSVPLMQRMKAAFDPDALMNPGKVFAGRA